MEKRVQNPIFTGFHPDPSMLRVGDTFYIANSTFEWYPGVRIFQSKDLVNWEFAVAPLNRLSLLDMRGIGSSEGIWAPDLSWSDGRFYLIYTVVRNQGRIKDMNNYLVSAEDINGPWSEPIYLNSSGFDPSLFHDEDGRKWLVNMEWDYRKGKGIECFTGILLQEYDEKQQKLVGKVKNIFRGTKLMYTEGPHLYRHGGYYYLMCAEGGTSYEHAVTVARSRTIDGPYEVDPVNPILTSRAEDALQKAGHASICDTKDGKWYLAHLCGRPLPGTKRCVLGRETALQEVVWTTDGWLRLKSGKIYPENEVCVDISECGGCNEAVPEDDGEKTMDIGAVHLEKVTEYRFREGEFGAGFLQDFQSLRMPLGKDIVNVTDRPGWLRMKGMDGIQSRFCQSLLARRQTDFHFSAELKMEFAPENFMESAGLIYRYNENNLYYLYISWDEELQSPVMIAAGIYDGEYSVMEQLAAEGSEFILGLDVEEARCRFFYRKGGEKHFIGPVFDNTNLSDDFTYGFTGAFVGMCVQDLQRHEKTADFEYFRYHAEKR